MAEGVRPSSPAITGSTRLAAVIGWPVRHSRSPQLANAAFAAAGLDWTMVALEVAPGDVARAVEAVRALDIGGLMVTMPHKADIAPFLDDLTPAALALGAVNSVAWVDDRLVGDNTDGAGLVASLRAHGIDPAGRHVVVLGAGGAARSVIWALAESGAADVAVLNRTADRAVEAARLAGSIGRVGSAGDLATADLVVNATSVGFGATEDDAGAIPCDPDLLGDRHTVVDLVYQPLSTSLLRAAGARGARVVDGLGMLVHQAALSLERWTGVAPDVAVMDRAARQGSPDES